MKLFIKAEAICVGCQKAEMFNIEVRKIKEGLLFVDWGDSDRPPEWVNPSSWQYDRLRNSKSRKPMNYDDAFCSLDCMYKYFDV